MNMNQFTQKSIEALRDMQSIALENGNQQIEQIHLLDALVSKEDIHAEVRNGYLTIHAEHKSENEEKDEKKNYIKRERSYGSFTRSFDLDGINSDEISAAYKDGILTLTLPKATTKVEEGRRLEIQ